MKVSDWVERYEAILLLESRHVAEFLESSDPRDVEKLLYTFRLSDPEEVWLREGDSPADIDQVRAALGGWIPPPLEAYLVVLGRKSRFYDLGVHCSAEEILLGHAAFDEWREETLRLEATWYGDGSAFQVPDDAVYLGNHCAYIYWFFTEMVDDPEVWQLMEGEVGVDRDAGIKPLGRTFSDLVCRNALAAPRGIVESVILGSAGQRQYRNK